MHLPGHRPSDSRRYADDVLAGGPPKPRAVPVVEAALGLVVEEHDGFCGAVVEAHKDVVVLEDRHGRRRTFPLDPSGFLLEGVTVTLIRPAQAGPVAVTRTASGSVALPGHQARVARASRIFVEGKHDAELVEKVWGADLRYEGVVVELLDGADNLPDALAEMRPSRGARAGVLLDHLVSGSKETRILQQVRSPHVLVVGHPYVDVWQAVRPGRVGLTAWPDIPRGLDWKTEMSAVLGAPDYQSAWRKVLGAVRSYADLEPALLGPVEALIDFVTEPPE